MEINGYILSDQPLQGGMALVYKGVKGNFTRAFKIVRPDKAENNARLVEKFAREINTLQVLDHPNIVKILDAYPYVVDGKHVTVLEMEWLKGRDLQRYIEDSYPNGLNTNEVKEIALQVLKGLKYAHEQNILHLDIKPSNLFKQTNGTVKIIDFGIAKVVGENAEIVDGCERLTLTTETGSTFKGTSAYASPEQWVGGRLNYTSDIFSFGKTLHFLCTGSNDPATEVRDNTLETVITKCTEQNPKHRYQNCQEIIKALENVAPPPPETVKCVNPDCRKQIAKGTKYCPHCGTNQDTPPNVPKSWKCNKCGVTWTDPVADDKTQFCCFCGSTKIVRI